MVNPYKEPVKIKGVLWQTNMRERFREEHPGYVTVVLKIPADSANEAYEAFKWIGLKSIPFTMIVGGDSEH
jgi:hypothetical protein